VGQIKKILSLLISIALLASCSQGGFETLKETTTVDIPIIQKVTKETYMNGQQFCAKYVNTTNPLSKEIGKWIEVPFDYSGSKKTTKIYTYVKKEFNPNLPSFIFVDGGPGQNTHTYKDILENEFNEIHFDQRGVGCSAPATWEEYSDQALYSSLYTANDIDEVRKVYGLETVSVYGVSYGTIPATIYANKFEKRTNSLVLEGVLGRVENLARHTYSVEKFNLIIDSLSPVQRQAFDKIMSGSGSEKEMFVLMYFLGTAGYQDGGYRNVRDNYFSKLFPASGGTDPEVFNRAYKNILKYENPYDTPQHPGSVDDNVLTRFYCKELGGFSKDKFNLNYNKIRGFFEEAARNKTTWADDCAKQGITKDMEKPYDEREFPTSVPVYYLQGSHDGATIADGALNHWKHVPQAESYFLLSLKGGHNPALSKMRSSDQEISKAHKQLFQKALTAKPITHDFVKSLNSPIIETKNEDEKRFKFITWELFTSNKSNFSEIEKEFGGLRRLSR
jgi:proline iminopeptidase